MNKLFILISILVCGKQALAQYNDTTHYHTAYSSTGTINRTQDGNSYLLSNALNLGIHQKQLELSLAGSYVYGRQNNVLTNQDFITTLTANLYKFTPFKHSFYWALANYNTSFSLKINNQAQAGLGIAYSIVDKKNAYISISDGVLYDQSDLMIDTLHDVYHTYRNSFRLLFHFNIKDVVVFDANGFLQNSFTRGSDYIIKSNSTLTVKLKKWLGFTTSLAYNRMNRTASENLLLTYGLTFDKYF